MKTRTNLVGWLAVARPDRQPSGYVWWGSSDEVIDPTCGVIPFDVRRQLVGNITNPPGSGGAWYDTEEAALADLRKVTRPQLERHGAREEVWHEDELKLVRRERDALKEFVHRWRGIFTDGQKLGTLEPWERTFLGEANALLK